MMKRYLYFAVFASGMTTLAIELSASRLLGSVFGTSNLVWASIIGLILIYLTVGYFIGGPWADRSPYHRTMYAILAWGAFACGLAPLFSRPVLRLAADAFDQLRIGVLLGSFTAVLILFVVPVTLLGTISPFAIRLAISNSEEAGRVSGRIYAISTLGSFIGTFLPVLVLIPLVGTTMTFIGFSLFLLIVALVGLGLAEGWRKTIPWLWMPIVLVALAWFWEGRPIKTTEGQIFETESAYNYIQVLQQGQYRYLRLNEGQGIHSEWHPTQLGFAGPWEQFLAAPFFNAPTFKPEQVKRMAIIGLAAGTLARQATAVYGPIPIDGFEIDPEIIRVARQVFRYERTQFERNRSGWPLGPGTQRQEIFDHRGGRLPAALYPLAPDHSGIFPERLRSPGDGWYPGDQCRSFAQRPRVDQWIGGHNPDGFSVCVCDGCTGYV